MHGVVFEGVPTAPVSTDSGRPDERRLARARAFLGRNMHRLPFFEDLSILKIYEVEIMKGECLLCR